MLVGEVSGSGQTTFITGVSSSFNDSTETSAFVRAKNLERMSGTAMVSAWTYGTIETRLCLFGEKNFTFA